MLIGVAVRWWRRRITDHDCSCVIRLLSVLTHTPRGSVGLRVDSYTKRSTHSPTV